MPPRKSAGASAQHAAAPTTSTSSSTRIVATAAVEPVVAATTEKLQEVTDVKSPGKDRKPKRKAPVKQTKEESRKNMRVRQADSHKDVREDAVRTVLAAEKVKHDAVRQLAGQLLGGPPLEHNLATLTRILDHVRTLDKRYTLTPYQLAAIPAIPRLLALLHSIFLNPTTFDPAPFRGILVRATVGDDVNSDLAQFYLRRLAFSSHDDMKTFLLDVQARKMSYEGRITAILSLSESLGAGSRCLLYGGYTIANSPIGRELDDEEADNDYSLVKAAIQAYMPREVEQYSVPALTFRLGTGGRNSILAGRGDYRVGLFESLIVDSLGFHGLNTAPPGIVIDKVVSPTQQRTLNVIRSMAIEDTWF